MTGDDPFVPFDETPAASEARGSCVPVPDHLVPSRSGPARWRVSARAFTGDRWVSTVDADWEPTLRMKSHLLATRRRDVALAVPDASNACEEAAAGVLASVGAPATRSSGLEALVDAARVVADDLCILVANRDAEHELSAAVLCSPNRWRLAEKLGDPMGVVHAPVPRYAEEVGGAVESLLARLSADRPVWRSNWGVLDTAALYQPVVPPVRTDVSPPEMWLRVEFQTLRRLPRTGAVLFTIRTHLENLGALAGRNPAAVRELGRLVAETPDDVAAYKSLLARRDEIVDWCAQVV